MAKTVSLVLGSGGARGYAHIGVIEVLEQADFEIRALVGSSMGALIGGLYANGTLAEYKAWALPLELLDILRLVDFTFQEAGIIKGDRVFDRLAHLLGEVNIEDLPIAFTAVATDLLAGREVWLQRGSLRQAIRASIAIPMIFTPVVRDGRILVDGGVLNPLPVTPTGAYHTDLVIAVNVNAVQSQNYPAAPVLAQEKPEESGNRLMRLLSGMGWTGRRKERALEMGLFELMNRSFEVMQKSLSSYKIAGYPPDLVIEIPADACNFYDFHKAHTMIELGRAAAWQALENMARKPHPR